MFYARCFWQGYLFVMKFAIDVWLFMFIMWTLCVSVSWRWCLGFPVGPIAFQPGMNCSMPFYVTLVDWMMWSRWKCLPSICAKLIKMLWFVLLLLLCCYAALPL